MKYSASHYTKGLTKKELLLFWIGYALIYTFSLIPLWIMYRISDCLFYLIYYIIGYRRKLVRKNLTDSFPDKTEKEIKTIEKRFYRWFCDYIVETVKMFSMSEKEMRKRMIFENLEEVNETIRSKRSASILLAHYCNWEWISSLQIHLKHEGKAVQIYHELESKPMDKLLLHSRGRFGSTSIEMQESFAKLTSWKKQGVNCITGYISDQIPGFSGMHFWTTFLNHPKTPCFSGAERVSRILDTDCYYLTVRRPKRGYYTAKFIKITDAPASTEKFHLTSVYFRMLEEDIIRTPHLWLWSHNRWKRTWEDFCKFFPDEKKRQIILNKL